MRDKIVPSALRLIETLPVAPVIIRPRSKHYMDVLETIRPITNIRNRLLGTDRELELVSLFPRLRTIPTFNLIAALLPREWIYDLADAREVEKIYPNKLMTILEYPTVPDEGVYSLRTGVFGEKMQFTTTYWTKKLIGADIANQKGFNGSGIKVAVIDTGASKTHEMLRHVIIDSVMAQVHDENGHGTWCTATVGGRRGKDDRLSRRLRQDIICEGIAPNAWLISIKALGYLIGTGSTDGILKAIEIAVMKYNADVISMSLGGPSEEERPEDDPYYEVFRVITEQGVIPVVAAGNEGPNENTISSPGCIPFVLTVGAYDPINGTLAEFSSRGPTNWGDIKPDVVAPGVNIHNAIVGLLDSAGDNTRNRYSPISGTSMATPHVAGLVTLMKQAYEMYIGAKLTVDEIKKMMQELGHEKTNDDGWGPITWQMFEIWMSTEYGVEI